MNILFSFLLAIAPSTASKGLKPMVKPPDSFMGYMLDPTARVCWAPVDNSWSGMDTCMARIGPGILGLYTTYNGYGIAEMRAAVWRVIGTTPAAPMACSAATAGVILYVDDTDDGAIPFLCICATDKTGFYGWAKTTDFKALCF